MKRKLREAEARAEEARQGWMEIRRELEERQMEVGRLRTDLQLWQTCMGRPLEGLAEEWWARVGHEHVERTVWG